MKTIYRLFFLLVLGWSMVSVSGQTTNQPQDSNYTIQRALAKKLIKAEIRGVDTIQQNSWRNFGKCMQITLTNLSPQKFNVNIEAGQQLLPADTTVQTMLVTEGAVFTLSPRGKQKKYINALCMQMPDKAPDYSKTFSLGSMSSGSLLQMAKLAEKNKYFDSTAQLALWCITDDLHIKHVTSIDSVETNTLQKFVSEATGQPIPEYHNGKLVGKTTTVIEGGWPKEHITTLTVYDAKGKIVKQPVKDQKSAAGFHSYTVVLSTVDLKPGKYTLKLFIDNKLAHSQTAILEAPE